MVGRSFCSEGEAVYEAKQAIGEIGRSRKEELRVLGIDVADAPSLDEKSLRRAFRERSRALHPDAVGKQTSPEHQGMDAHAAEATIYDLNDAYEAVRQVLW